MTVDYNALFDLSQVYDNWRLLVSGALMTISIALTATILAGILGIVMSMLLSSRRRWVAVATRGYVEVIRGTPLLIQMYILYYGLPALGIVLSGFWAAVIALGVNSAAYVGEISRGAIGSIDRAQRESGFAVGMSTFTTYRRIVLPQAFPVALPSLVGEVIDIVKWSSLATVIAVPEVTQIVYQIVSQSFRGFAILFLLLAGFYFTLTWSLSIMSRALESRLTSYRAR
ncbi:MAG: amino acid ABC transporter permease [Rhizobiaceae bacterium]